MYGLHLKTGRAFHGERERQLVRQPHFHLAILHPLRLKPQLGLAFLFHVFRRGRGNNEPHRHGERPDKKRRGDKPGQRHVLLKRRSRTRKKRIRASRWLPSVETSTKSAPAARVSCRNASRRWRAAAA